MQVTVTEFGKVLRCMGHKHEDWEIQELFDAIDEDRGGEIGFVEFADMWCGPETTVQRLVKERCGELRALFNLFDEDGGGLLDLGELSNIMKHLGRKPAEEELAELVHLNLEEIDDIYAVELNFPEFVSMIAGTATKGQVALQKQVRDFREAFELFDADGGGSVDLQEFCDTMEMFGHVQINMEDLANILSSFDNDDLEDAMNAEQTEHCGNKDEFLHEQEKKKKDDKKQKHVKEGMKEKREGEKDLEVQSSLPFCLLLYTILVASPCSSLFLFSSMLEGNWSLVFPPDSAPPLRCALDIAHITNSYHHGNPCGYSPFLGRLTDCTCPTQGGEGLRRW